MSTQFNGYQAQISSLEYSNDTIPVNENLFSFDSNQYAYRIGIFAPPGSVFLLNRNEDTELTLEIGNTFMYEANDVHITTLEYLRNKYQWDEGYIKYDTTTIPENVYSLPITNPQRIAIDFIVKTGT